MKFGIFVEENYVYTSGVWTAPTNQSEGSELLPPQLLPIMVLLVVD